MHALLLRVFEQLEQADIRYCLIRGYEELEQIENGGDVDLLVETSQLDRLRQILARLEFARVPIWGHAPHHFFIAYDPGCDWWLKLDVVTTVSYGKPIYAIQTDLAAACLEHRRRRGPTFVPAPEEELVTLLLHCALDKAAFAPARSMRIAALRQEVTDERRLTQLLQIYWSPAMTWPKLAASIDARDWPRLLCERAAVIAHATRGQKLATAVRHARGRVLRKLDRIAGMLQPRALTVALLAPDGGGKTTLANQLTRTFYLPSRYIYMGTNAAASTVGLPTTRWIQSLSERPPSARQLPIWMLARGLRFPNNLIEQWYRYGVGYYHLIRGRLVLFDRYVYDSQPVAERPSLKTRIRRRLLSAAAPKPDLVVLLDAPGEVLYARKGEHSPAALEEQRQHYLGLRDRLPQMVVVDATHDAEQVRRDVTSLIWRGYARRLAGS